MGKLFDDRGNAMSPSHATKGGKRWCYYVSQVLLQGRKSDAGSAARVPAPEIEKRVADAIGGRVEADDRAAILRAAIERVTISRTAITIQLTSAVATESRDRTLTVRWTAPSPTRRREILQGEGAQTASIRPMREKARVGIVKGLRDAHRWLDELMADRHQSIETIAAREGRTERSIRMTLSLAFLAPTIIKTAIEGRMPRGFGVNRLADATPCARRIFTERFDDNILKPWARRTARLDDIVHCLALALGGRPAASFARRLSMPVSNDTLLRALRRRGSPSFPPPSVIGIDDWAWRRNQRYGTLICDLERRKTIALLPDREPATAQAWLAAQPQIGFVARDRGGGYGLAAQKALPHAVQIADRWHLMENASQAFLDAARKSMRDIRAAVGAATITPELLTSAEKLQYEGFQRREETNAAILAMSQEGATIKQIVRRAGYSRGLVRKVLRGQRSDIFRVRGSSLEPCLPWLDEQWAAGRRHGSELWRALKAQGFRGCLRVVSEWSGRRHRSEKTDASALGRAPSRCAAGQSGSAWSRCPRLLLRLA